ncbi:MAG: glutamine-hydrolyzing carbamoyl-phosphate synthase small subunit [Promethearchaeota archaeon]
MISLVILENTRPAVLVLSNGVIMRGTGFGATGKVFGELVFTTFTAAGYNCALTDPSNQGQIYLLTYPLVGNYGVPAWEKDQFGLPKHFESDSIKCTGFVVHEACKTPSHYTSKKSLDEFLYEEGIPGIEGVDTRELTKLLRVEGVQIGMLQVFESTDEVPSAEQLLREVRAAQDPNLRHLVQEVSIKQPQTYHQEDPIGTVVIIDCGVKYNIIRELLARNLEIIVVPFNFSYEQVMTYKPNGILFSNGPGDPKKCVETIQLAKKIIQNSLPTMGICLGNQILCLAAGGDTYKQKFGHRGGNKPVIDIRTGKAFITSQNHGYAVDTDSLKNNGSGFLPLFRNADDNTNEGIYHPTKPIFAVQFHPEACPGPEDTTFLFDEFIRHMAFHKFTLHQHLGGEQ